MHVTCGWKGVNFREVSVPLITEPGNNNMCIVAAAICVCDMSMVAVVLVAKYVGHYLSCYTLVRERRDCHGGGGDSAWSVGVQPT